MKNISKFVFYYLMGWKITNDFPTDIKKYIIIVAPHTSNLDFIIGIMVKFIKSVDIKFIGKHTLFKSPYGFIFKALGGTPVNRSKSKNMVQAIIDIYNTKDEFIFALSPEGTRKKIGKWKTGFYHVAKGAKIPIVMATIDFGKKEVLIDKPFYITGNQKNDYGHFHNFFKNRNGKNPDQFEPDFHKNII